MGNVYNRLTVNTRPLPKNRTISVCNQSPTQVNSAFHPPGSVYKSSTAACGWG